MLKANNQYCIHLQWIIHTILTVIHACMFITNIWLLIIYGISNLCMQMISVWMICDAIEKIYRCFNNTGCFYFIFTLALFIWNLINIRSLTCDDIIIPYYNYALGIMFYETIILSVYMTAFFIQLMVSILSKLVMPIDDREKNLMFSL